MFDFLLSSNVNQHFFQIDVMYVLFSSILKCQSTCVYFSHVFVIAPSVFKMSGLMSFLFKFSIYCQSTCPDR